MGCQLQWIVDQLCIRTRRGQSSSHSLKAVFLLSVTYSYEIFAQLYETPVNCRCWQTSDVSFSVFPKVLVAPLFSCIFLKSKHLYIPPYQKKPAEVVQASDKDDSWGAPTWGFPGISHWEEALGHTHDMLQKLHLLAGLGMSCYFPRRAGASHPLYQAHFMTNTHAFSPAFLFLSDLFLLPFSFHSPVYVSLCPSHTGHMVC